MMISNEIIEALKSLDELSLLELLEINSSDLIDAFYEKIHERLPYIIQNLEE